MNLEFKSYTCLVCHFDLLWVKSARQINNLCILGDSNSCMMSCEFRNSHLLDIKKLMLSVLKDGRAKPCRLIKFTHEKYRTVSQGIKKKLIN